MPPRRLPIVNSDDGTWGDIIRQFIAKEHYNDDTDNAANGGHHKITIRPGTATAGTAPLKFTSGTLLTTPEAGAIEFTGDNLYFTQTSGPTRKKLAAYDDASGATGDIYYRNSTGYFTRLAAGSTGDFLTIASGIPSWTAAIVGKTINASNNTISNITVSNMAASAVVTEAEGIASNDNDTTIPTSAAVKDYADNILGSVQGAFMTGTVGTAAGTVAKTVTLDSPWNATVPAAGDWFLLTFTSGQTVASPTLSINSSTAYPIQTPQAQTNASNTAIATAGTVLLYFDGSRYVLPGATQNTTYSAISDAEIINTASTTARLMTGQRAETLMANEASVARTLTNKSISGSNNTLANIPQSAITSLTTDLAGKAAATHTHVSTDISNSTSVGRSVLTAADAAAARTAIGAGTGSGDVTLTGAQNLTNKTLTTPTIASFTNATHNHTNAAGGGQLTATTALNATGTPSSATYLRGDNTWAALSATGDASTNTSTSVDGEVVVFSGTGGKTLKRATGSGLAKLTSGVLSTATAGTDYVTPSGTETLTNKTLDATNTITVADNNLTIIDDVDSSKVVKLSLELLATSRNLNIRFPNLVSGNHTLVTLNSTATLQNKTMSGADNTFTNIPMSALGTGSVTGSNNGTLTSLTLWKGTNAQYVALGTYDANTIYVVTA